MADDNIDYEYEDAQDDLVNGLLDDCHYDREEIEQDERYEQLDDAHQSEVDCVLQEYEACIEEYGPEEGEERFHYGSFDSDEDDEDTDEDDDDDSGEALSLSDAADIYASSGCDEDNQFGYTHEELMDEIRK